MEDFPFGRPGAGAPLRDTEGAVVTKRGYATQTWSRITSTVTEEDVRRKDKLQNEMRKALLEQMEEKDKRRKAEREHALELERKEEARFQKHLEMSRNDLKTGTGSRQKVGKDERRMTPAPPPAPSTAADRAEAAPVANRKEGMSQKYAELDALLVRLKQEAASFTVKPAVPLHNDFESMKTELYSRPSPRPPSIPAWKPLKDSSTFVPRPSSFAVTGQRLVQTRHVSLTALKEQDYSAVESKEVRTQLGTLDGLLHFCHTEY